MSGETPPNVLDDIGQSAYRRLCAMRRATWKSRSPQMLMDFEAIGPSGTGVATGILAALITNLHAGLLRSMARCRQVVVDLDDFDVYRPRDEVNPEQAPIPDSWECVTWRMVSNFISIMNDAVRTVPSVVEILNWSRVTMHWNTIMACRSALRLSEQVGPHSETFVPLTGPAAFDALFVERLRCGLRSTEALSAVIHGAMNRLWQQAAARGVTGEERRGLLRFELRPDGLWAEWMTGTGRTVHRESLDNFARSVCEEMARELAGCFCRFSEERTRDAEVLESRLARISPVLAGHARTALEKRQRVGVRLFTARVRNGTLPLDVWLYLDPSYSGRGHAACTLVAYRPHRDFVLEAADGSMYYFPPCIIAARLLFMDDGMRGVHAEYPTVRQPRHGYKWRHPYTGDLAVPADKTILSQPENAVMYPPSPDARALFPLLGTRVETAAENNLCLDGQGAVLQTIRDRVAHGFSTNAPPDVLGAIMAMHDVARLGLTRSHEGNTATPRAHLVPDEMPYPLNGRPVIGPLAKRVFRFNSRDVQAPGRVV